MKLVVPLLVVYRGMVGCGSKSDDIHDSCKKVCQQTYKPCGSSESSCTDGYCKGLYWSVPEKDRESSENPFCYSSSDDPSACAGGSKSSQVKCDKAEEFLNSMVESDASKTSTKVVVHKPSSRVDRKSSGVQKLQRLPTGDQNRQVMV